MDRFPDVAAAAPVSALKLSELIGSLSYALDLTEGQPEGHCVRSCWIGMHVGREAGLAPQQLWELYYTLLLKDIGCSSNAARICELYLTNDLRFKRDFKLVRDSTPHLIAFVLKHTGLKAGLAERFRAVLAMLRDGQETAQELIVTRCSRGAAIARLLRFPESVAAGIYSLDEHYNGKGRPNRLKGNAIPVYARIAMLAQLVDVFHTAGGGEAALAELRHRSGSWLDPELVRVFERVAAGDGFWTRLAAPDLAASVFAMEPAGHTMPIDDDYLDDIATAFGQVVDSKSPYTGGHSARVALYTDMIAESLGLSPGRRRWLKRGALLHDVGKLGVSNSILDKAGALDREEWAQVRRHAEFTETILTRIDAFAELGRIAGAHHERLDGGGYPRGLAADRIALETRIITTADIFDAITADRPYRAAIPPQQALAMMVKTVGTALDPDCFAALKDAVARVEL